MEIIGLAVFGMYLSVGIFVAFNDMPDEPVSKWDWLSLFFIITGWPWVVWFLWRLAKAEFEDENGD